MASLASEPLNPDKSGVAIDGGAAVEESKRPEDTAFKQQRLPSWQPVMSPPHVISCFFVTAIVFIVIGAVVVVTSDNIQEVIIRYDQVRGCDVQDRLPVNGYACDPFALPIQITKTMKAPVYIYYKLENLYQNHRRYAKSRSDDQLSGGSTSSSGMSDCSPLKTPGEYQPLGALGSAPYQVGDAPSDVGATVYSPCGLIAWSMFNDSFSLYHNETSGNQTLVCDGENFDNVTGEPLTPMRCKKRGIAWPSDPGVRYTAPERGPSTITNYGWPGACTAGNSSSYNVHLCNGWYLGEVGHKIPNTQDEDLMVWMRLASLSSFRKLYRVITSDLEAGSYTLQVKQRYDMRSFDGKKSFVLSTTGWIGGKNYFLGGLYIGVGALCFILGVGFLVKYLTTQRRVANL